LRAKEKDLYPDMWDVSAAGHVSAGEDPITSALREVKEEIGLKLKKEDLDYWMTKRVKWRYEEIVNNEFCYAYLHEFDKDINQLKLQKEEVQKIQFLPIGNLEEDLRMNPDKYVPHGDYWFEVLNEIKQRLLS
jgi:isopentenyldiphosphate isomerase